MIELCNATESGMLRRGAYDFEIEENEKEFYFIYKMVDGGFVVGNLDAVHKKELYAIWEAEDYGTYTKLILLADDKENGTLSFIKDGFYLQVPFTTSSLSLDLECNRTHYDQFKQKRVD